MGNYCRKCGQPLEDSYKVCPFCGTSVNEQRTHQTRQQFEVDTNEILWGILGFFFPLVGVILFFVWQDQRPMSAKYAGVGGLIGFGVRILFGFASFSLFFPFQIFGPFF